MAEVLLRNNRRALLMGMVAPALLAILGILLAASAVPRLDGFVWRALGAAMAAVAGLAVGALGYYLRQPRLAYESGQLLLYLRSGPPIRLPIDVVECFLYGHAPALLPGSRNTASETRSVVIRLAERATDWAHVDVKPALGSWCDGQVVIRGTWCEPLSVDLIRRLNVRLAELGREHAAAEAAR